MNKFTIRLAGFCLVLSALFFTKTGFTQTTYTIPSSGLQDGAYGPVDICDGRYTAEADIFPAGSLTYGTVTKIAYDQIQGSASNVPIKIYMMNSSASTFSADGSWSSALSGSTLVFSGSVSFTSAGWNTITLNTPFTYSSGNLEVMIETDWGTSTVCTGNPVFYYYTASGNTDEFWEETANSSSALQSETGVIGDQPAPIEITITACTNPTISTQPSTSTQTICQGGSATALSLTASGTSLTYQWYKNTTSSNSGGTSISGATSSSYTPSTTTTGTLYYYCIVNSNGCTATSNVSGSIVINTIPTISSQSTGTQTLCQGSTATAMSISATGTSLTYQWYSNTTSSNSGGTLISAATSSSYSPPTSTTGTSYYYCVVSSNGGCPVTSAVSGAIIINGTAAPTGTTPQIFCTSANPTVASLSATGSSILWYTSASEGTPLASTATLTTGTYYASQTVSGCQSVNTLAVSVTVNGAPTITSQSTGPQSVCRDSFALALSINATGTSLTYQWYKDTASVNSGGTLIAAATASTYTPPTTTVGTEYYYCVVSGIAPCTQAVSTVSGAIVTYLCNINGLPAGGDLSGYYPNPTVAKINGMTVPASSTGYLYNNGSGTLSWGLGGIWNQNGNDINYTNGNVGIGTTNPQYPLEVNGNASVTGNLYGQNIYAANQLSAGNFRFVNGVIDTVADSIVSSAPVLQLSANRVSLANNLSVTANSVAMSGIVADTTADTVAAPFVMQMDKAGNLTPVAMSTLLYGKKPFHPNACLASLNNGLPFNVSTLLNNDVTEFVPCLSTGFGTYNPDAFVSINASANPGNQSYQNVFTIGTSSNPSIGTEYGTLTDIFTIDHFGNTNVGGTLATNGATPTPNGYLMASFNNGSNKIILTSSNQASDFNQITQAGDAGIFWTDNGTSNNNSGFVIGPWANALLPAVGLRIDAAGNVHIGAAQPYDTYSLDVAGTIRAFEVKVCTSGCDFVFEPNYKLMSLDTLYSYVQQYHHLPEVASASDMQKDGMGLSQISSKLLQKVEELTLYTIQQDQKMKTQQEELDKQSEIIKELEIKLDELSKKIDK